MSLNTHITTLQQRHTALDQEITAAMVSKPAMSDAEIKEMKRRKLRLKEEIERLQRSGH
ncbi:YdcH family protein [Jiella sp. MQZ9-1]|uniref:YdcH family protein n=1 Tax=Jiella flava TaxID=2816857 RepID=A0A939FY11_9HYPH|nr:YdcH family protein [Jiella flava]MBO0662964.1 YdcH family protein [Jiella flava]MCD2471276.1 YdcH family protein [Jiella flava]